MKTDAVPVFPTGIIGIYNNPNNFSNDFDPTHFKIEKYDGANKYRTGKFVNVLKDDSLTELRKWISECVEDYLKNELHMRYESFFFSESWLNVNVRGGNQPIHNHSNSILSGVYYLRTVEKHPPLEFHKNAHPGASNQPFISLREHYEGQHPNTAEKLAFPCEQDSMLVFQSQMFHSHKSLQTDEQRISLSWNALVNFEKATKENILYNDYLYRIRFVEEQNVT
jgi:uncharacterized protein (TIGR02466 family)